MSALRRPTRDELAARLAALDPIALAIVEDELERLEECEREAQRLGRDPSETVN